MIWCNINMMNDTLLCILRLTCTRDPQFLNQRTSTKTDTHIIISYLLYYIQSKSKHKTWGSSRLVMVTASSARTVQVPRLRHNSINRWRHYQSFRMFVGARFEFNFYFHLGLAANLVSHAPKNVPNIPKLQSWSHRSHDQSWSTQVSQNVSISIPDISRLWYLVILDGCHQITILQLHAGTYHDHTVQHRPGIQWFEELSLYAEQLLSLGRWFGKALAILFGGMNCGTSSYQHPVRDDELADPFQRPCLRRCPSLLCKQLDAFSLNSSLTRRVLHGVLVFCYMQCFHLATAIARSIPGQAKAPNKPLCKDLCRTVHSGWNWLSWMHSKVSRPWSWPKDSIWFENAWDDMTCFLCDSISCS